MGYRKCLEKLSENDLFFLPRSSSVANPEGVDLQAVTDKSHHMTEGNEENSSSKSTTSKSHQEQQHQQSASKQQQQKVFKPIQNWHKIMKISSDQPLSKLTVDQVFRNVIPPYVPHVPPNTSERCIGKFSNVPLHFLGHQRPLFFLYKKRRLLI